MSKLNIMKAIFLLVCTMSIFLAFGQPANLQPVEDGHALSPLVKGVGVIVVLALGIIVYMLIKKNPRKDAN